jgi:hypothetical protein
MATIHPFRFETAAVLTRLTNRRARSLSDLQEGMRVATGSMIFHHTYNSLLDRHFVAGAPQNDFVHWVDRSLRLRALAERLGAIDVYAFTDLQELRRSFVDVLDEHVSSGAGDSSVPADQEFHFLESVSVVTPTPYVVADLVEFREALFHVGIRSIYHHFLTARLRLRRKSNDFSVWLAERIGEPDLALRFEQIDPGVGTLEDAREGMIRLVDKTLGERKRKRILRIGLLGSSVAGAIAAGIREGKKSKAKYDGQAR